MKPRKDISEIIKRAINEHEEFPKNDLFARIESELPREQKPAFRLIKPSAMRVWASAAALLFIPGIFTWWNYSAQSYSPISDTAIEFDELEISNSPKPNPLLRVSDYQGIIINEGSINKNKLRACIKC